MEGNKISLGDREFILTPINFKRVKKMLEAMKGIKESSDLETLINKYAQIVHIGISHDYPDVSLDWIEEKLNLKNYTGILHDILVIAGLRAKGSDKGETQPVINQLSGEISTPSS